MDALTVEYVKTSDGFNIAYAVKGSGRPAVAVSGLFNHLQIRWQSPDAFYKKLALRFTLVMFDRRGTGMSGRGLPGTFEMPDLVRDLEEVIDHVGLNKTILIAIGSASHTAVSYAVKHPERVDALILFSPGVVKGSALPVLFRDEATKDWDAFLYAMSQANNSHEETLKEVQDLKRMVEVEDFITMVRTPSSIADELEQVTVPTLVLTGQSGPTSEQEGADVASRIAGARMVNLKGGRGVSAVGDGESGLPAIDEFVAALPESQESFAGLEDEGLPGSTADLSQRELEVLRLLAQGKSNPEIAKELFITRNTVQNHVGSILTKTNLNNRTEAAVYAQQHGLV